MGVKSTGEHIPGTCNAHGHPPDCRCGWGGIDTGCWTTSQVTTPVVTWEATDFTRKTACPQCGHAVFFVRHNGGSVWFDDLGYPWPKHPCMAASSDSAWVTSGIPDAAAHNRVVFGVVRESFPIEEGVSADFVIDCSDGTVVRSLLVFPRNPAMTVGSLVLLELTPTNEVEARRFKALEDVVAAERAKQAADEKRKRSLKKRQETISEQKGRFSRMMDDAVRRYRYGGR